MADDGFPPELFELLMRGKQLIDELQLTPAQRKFIGIGAQAAAKGLNAYIQQRAEAKSRRPPPSPKVDPAVQYARDVQLLGVPPGASAAQIQRAYRALARRHHPDRGGDAEAMTAINLAYARLTKASPR